MTRIIKDVFVNGISLVSKKETPAVEQAENGFALFKTVKKGNTGELKKIKLNLQKQYFSEIKKNLNINK